MFKTFCFLALTMAAQPQPEVKGPPPPTDEIKALVKDLGDDSFPTREAASAKLKKLGYKALSACIAAQKDSDLERAARAGRIVEAYYNVYYNGKEKDVPPCPSIWMLDEKHRFPKGVKIVKDTDPPDANQGQVTGPKGWCKEMTGYDLSAYYFKKARKKFNDGLKTAQLATGWRVDEGVWINDQIEKDAMRMYIQDQLNQGVDREEVQKLVNISAKMCVTHKLMHRHYGGGSPGTVIPGPAVPKEEVPDNSEYRFQQWGG